MCLIGGPLWIPSRIIGPMLEEDHAPQIRSGVPYSKWESKSDPAGLSEMDALCAYLAPSPHGTNPLRKPDAEERSRAARQLDAAGALTPDQRLLRVLLDDDQQAFEQALVDRLVEHRESVGAGPIPRSLLPVGTIALAAPAVLVHD